MEEAYMGNGKDTEQNSAQQEQAAQPRAAQAPAGAPAVELVPVVALGASAGGVPALQKFLSHLPKDSGMAFVVVMHLSPDYESHLASILQGFTTLPVRQVNTRTRLEPNHVYVVPPNHNLVTSGNSLDLQPLETDHGQREPIDHFFRSVAASHGLHAICIVLSGTGTDGTLGLLRVKEIGGLTVAQDPADAEYDAMPRSAIATGAVELVLPAAEMAPKLLDYVRSVSNAPVPGDGEEMPEDVREVMQRILTHVRVRTGYDFTRYKPSTLLRRVRRRMQLYTMESLSQYLDYIRDHGDEAQTLFADFLITVTNFFRDPETFTYLDQEIIPRLLQSKTGNDQLRIWVPGCATGEEAYSIGILLLEHAHRLNQPPSIQIFATDLSDAALRRAREGLYPESIDVDVTPARLARFFTKEQGGYRVRQELRDLVLFAPHSLLKDPPFSKIDLISCRNVLIYLQRSVQQQIFELFHYAMLPNGYLLLGSAETVDDSRFFRDISRRYGIFQRQPMVASELRLPLLPLIPPASDLGHPSVPAPPERSGSYGKVYVQLMEHYGPPSLFVDPEYNVLYFAEGVSRYLHQPRGEPTNNILRRIREELRVELTTALFRAFEHKEASQSLPIVLRIDDSLRSVTLDVRPATEPELQNYVLVLFYESTPHEFGAQERAASNRQVVTALEEELREVRRRLQATIEQYETTKEEMRAANEELQSMNEELRSTAEELETSKEELQSINEELLTVNQENKSKIEELSQLTSDLQNLLASTDIATLFLDRELHIKRFTPRISDVFNVLATDRGRPLAHITHKLRYPNMLNDASTVLQTLVPIQKEVDSEDDRWYAIRILPYRTTDDRIDGIVITLVDITQHRKK